MRFMVTIAFAAALAACGGEKAKPAAHEEHSAQHGGEVVEFGNHEGHVEVVHDDEAGVLRLWAYDASMKPLSLDAPPTLSFTAADGPKQLVGTGEGNEWRFADESLKGEPEGARLKIVASGRSYTPALAHHH